MGMKIQPNENNDLKYIKDLNDINETGIYIPQEQPHPNTLIITEDGNIKKKQKLEYFTE